MAPIIRTLLLAGSVALAVTVVLLMLRFLADGAASLRRRVRARRGGEEAVDITLAPMPQGWRGRMDHAFGDMVRRTMLGIDGLQALGIVCLGGVLLGGGLYLWREEYWMAGVGLALGMLFPLGVFLFLQGRWRARLQEQLPDALFLMARSTRAGLSLEQSLDTVGHHGDQPLRDEFRQAAEQTKLGLSAPAALRRMADRVRVVDLNALVSVATLHRSMGGNLPALLDRLAASTRDRNQFRGYFKAATALGRVTGVALACIAPVIFIGYLIWQPDYITRFASSPGGLNALGAALMLELIGITWLWLLLQIEY